VTLVRREPARPSPSDLQRYAGTYVSDELGGATYLVAANDSAITLRTGTQQPETFGPAYGDTFAGFATVEFTRDQGGGVNGMLMSTGRVRKVSFARMR